MIEDLNHEGSVTLPLARYEQMRGKEQEADNRAALQQLFDDQSKRMHVLTSGMHWLLSVVEKFNRGLVVMDGPHYIDIAMELDRMGITLKNAAGHKGYDIEVTRW